MDEIADGIISFDFWLYSLLAACVAQALAAICYRFDFSNDESQSDHETYVVAVNECTSAKGFVGVALPKANLPSFPKPYFTTVLAGWFAGNVLLSFIIAIDCFPINAHDPAYGLFAGLASAPFALAGILTVAVLRGDFKKMWAYKEHWGAPSGNRTQHVGPTPAGSTPLLIEVKTEVTIQEDALDEKDIPVTALV